MSRLKFRNYHSVYQYLGQFTDYERLVKFHSPQKVWNLKRMIKLMNLLGNPEQGLKLIHIAGTKGKGSTAIFLSNLLQSQGYKTGLFTSPHLVDLRERIQINNGPISKQSFTKVMNRLSPALQRIKPTFFEIITALALVYFREQQVDYAVIEVGLGGRLDATNIIKPIVTIITRIDYDHMDKLGKTLSEIASEKAGIIKFQTPVITIKQSSEVMKVIRQYARKQKAPLIIAKGNNQKVKLSVHGRHQRENMALALTACEYIIQTKIRNPKSEIRNVILPARIEVVNRNPLTILDVAHNPVSMRALAETIKNEFNYHQLILVIGLARDKEVRKILDSILPLSNIIIFTKSDNPRLLEPMEFIDYLKESDLIKPIFLEPDCRQAVTLARRLATIRDLILVTGSFYLAGTLYPDLTSVRRRF